MTGGSGSARHSTPTASGMLAASSCANGYAARHSYGVSYTPTWTHAPLASKIIRAITIQCYVAFAIQPCIRRNSTKAHRTEKSAKFQDILTV